MAGHDVMPVLHVATLASAWGPVVLVASDRGVLAVELRGSVERSRRHLAARLRTDIDPADGRPHGQGERHLAGAVAAVHDALEGGSADVASVELDWTGIRAWDRRVLEGARLLARGEVTSYGRLARRIGAPGAARAVGSALGRNPFWILVPCHRIVAGDGTIGGYGDLPDALEIKRDLLALEGVALPITRLVD